MQIRRVSSRVDLTHSAAEASLNQLHTAEAMFNSNLPSTEGPGKCERETVRENEWVGQFPGSVSESLYRRIISLVFTGRQQHSLCHFYCFWEKFGGEASNPPQYIEA